MQGNEYLGTVLVLCGCCSVISLVLAAVALNISQDSDPENINIGDNSGLGPASGNAGSLPAGSWIPPWIKYDSAGRRVFSIQVGSDWPGQSYRYSKGSPCGHSPYVDTPPMWTLFPRPVYFSYIILYNLGVHNIRCSQHHVSTSVDSSLMWTLLAQPSGVHISEPLLPSNYFAKGRTPSINAQCRSKSIKIVALIPMSINSDQWSALRGISDQCHDFDRHWSALIEGVLQRCVIVTLI